MYKPLNHMKLLKYLIAIIEACHESKTVGTSLCDKRGKHILFRRKDQRKTYFVLQAMLCPLQSSHVKIY